MSAQAARSETRSMGFDGVSIQRSRVVGRTAARTASVSLVSRSVAASPHGRMISSMSLLVP
jgi:hypothetical protein